MNRQEPRRGSILKIVRVPHVSSPPNERSDAKDYQGYGILRDVSGEKIFFVGSAVQGAEFAQLEPGFEVTYELEPGPLARASQVRVAKKTTELPNTKKVETPPSHRRNPC